MKVFQTKKEALTSLLTPFSTQAARNLLPGVQTKGIIKVETLADQFVGNKASYLFTKIKAKLSTNLQKTGGRTREVGFLQSKFEFALCKQDKFARFALGFAFSSGGIVL